MEDETNFLFSGFDPEEHDLVLIDGFKDCIAGVMERHGQPPIVCYDRDKVIEKLMGRGMDLWEAEDHFGFNVFSSWVGEETPCFLTFNGQSKQI